MNSQAAKRARQHTGELGFVAAKAGKTNEATATSEETAEQTAEQTESPAIGEPPFPDNVIVMSLARCVWPSLLASLLGQLFVMCPACYLHLLACRV